MKKINLYDAQSLERFCAEAPRAFADTFSSIVLERNLTAVDPRVLERRYPALAFMASGIQAENSGGFANRIQSLRIRELGEFTLAGDATTPKGKISLAGEQADIAVYGYHASSTWTDDDVQQASLQNLNLLQRFLAGADKVYKQMIDKAGLIGIEGNEGLLNHSSFTAEASSYDSTTATGEQMYGEVAELITDQWNGVSNIPEFMADRVLFPISVMNRLASTLLKSEAGSKSVLTALRENFPSVEFLSSVRAESVSATRVMAAFSSNSEGLIFRLPQPLQIGEIVRKDSFDFTIGYKYRCAGLDVLEPAACRLMTGF